MNREEKIMNRISLVSIILGIFIIVYRSPLIFAPAAVMRFFADKVTANNIRIRALGLFFLAFGIAMVFAARESGMALGQVFVVWGVLVVFISIVTLVVFPGIYKQIIDFFSGVDSSVLRSIGVFAVAIGIILIWIGSTLNPV
jgi:uncharacterized protein YjeT (DUF2065 family)